MQDPEVLVKTEKEAIHSGQFMVSHFEAEAQDDEDEIAVPIPDAENKNQMLDDMVPAIYNNVTSNGIAARNTSCQQQPLSIETSLSKLFQCMSLAYRQKLTSPKWNRFRGIRLRWKDKIRLNNVIWRCWHMQFIKRQDTLICQFASPLDVDTHNKPEAVVLEGKYWKRKLAAVTAEYKKWRLYYAKTQFSGVNNKDGTDMFQLADMESIAWQSSDNHNMLVDEDYMGLMSDTLFSTITNQPFVFPDSREIARAGLADFIQPSLGPLQPNLDDYMDTFEPLQEFIYSKLPPVPEEQSSDNNLYKPVGWCYPELDLMSSNTSIQLTPQNTISLDHYNINQLLDKPDTRYTNQQQPQPQPQQQPLMIQNTISGYPVQQQTAPYQSVISKPGMDKIPKQQHSIQQQQQQQQAPLYKTNQQQQQQQQQPSDTCFPNFDVNSMQQTTAIVQQQQQHQTQTYKYPPDIKFTSQNIINNYKIPQVPVPVTVNQTQLMAPQQTTIQQQPSQQNRNQLSKSSLELLNSSPQQQQQQHPVHQRRQRSRSNTREPIKRPPLISAISDPSLVTPSTSALLTQLLTNNSESYLNPRLGICNPVVDDLQTSIVRVKEESNNLSLLSNVQQQQPLSSPLVVTQVPINHIQNTSDTMLLNSMSSSNSPILDQTSRPLESPTSPRDSIGSPVRDQPPHREHRRVGHIHAEQKRRYNIKNGFDMIHSLIPQLNQNPNAKLSKAAMLQKGAEYIRQLRQERNQIKEEMESLKQQIECLNTSISNCQSLLPGTGASVSRRWDNKMQEMFDDYVKKRTLENWKFWIFSLLFKPLLSSYNNFVSTSSLEDLYRSTLLWIEQHCTLIDLRPIVLNSLRYLCTKTDILSDPDRLPDEARQAVISANVNK